MKGPELIGGLHNNIGIAKLILNGRVRLFMIDRLESG